MENKRNKLLYIRYKLLLGVLIIAFIVGFATAQDTTSNTTNRSARPAHISFFDPFLMSQVTIESNGKANSNNGKANGNVCIPCRPPWRSACRPAWGLEKPKWWSPGKPPWGDLLGKP